MQYLRELDGRSKGTYTRSLRPAAQQNSRAGAGEAPLSGCRFAVGTDSFTSLIRSCVYQLRSSIMAASLRSRFTEPDRRLSLQRIKPLIQACIFMRRERRLLPVIEMMFLLLFDVGRKDRCDLLCLLPSPRALYFRDAGYPNTAFFRGDCSDSICRSERGSHF
jgi:hypothetical protein